MVALAAFDLRHEAFLGLPNNKPVAFGYGSHVCIGQHLARMEMRSFWEEILRRVDTVELADQPQNSVSNFVCGPKSVPVRYKMH